MITAQTTHVDVDLTGVYADFKVSRNRTKLGRVTDREVVTLTVEASVLGGSAEARLAHPHPLSVGMSVDAFERLIAETAAAGVRPPAEPRRDVTAPRYVLWLCDFCGDVAESDPDSRCEVCCKGTIRVVPVQPIPGMAQRSHSEGGAW